MLREATITSGIIAAFIGAPFFFFPYVDEDRISFTASITSLVVIYIVALIYLSLCVGRFTDYYTTGKKTIFEVDRKNLTIHQDGESTPCRLRDLHIDQMRVISLKKKSAHKPVLRSFDICSWRIVTLFNNAGQFQLSNGDTAEICLTDARHVVHIPTKLEHVLLLSPTDPNGLLLALIRAAAPAYKPEV